MAPGEPSISFAESMPSMLVRANLLTSIRLRKATAENFRRGSCKMQINELP